jgi:hypothetical protein
VLAPSALAVRQSCVIEYLTLLESASHVSWFEFSASASLASALVLCHPLWLDAPAAHREGLGLHSFRGGVVGRECQSRALWGYPCPLTEEPIESDHLFPMSLGGPAVGTNQVWLCRVHNQWKGANLMDFPWERGIPAWLPDQIERMVRLVRRDGVLHR